MKTCIVIGSGILGATTAYRLAKHGVKVIVVDRNDKGQATTAAAGIISPWLAKRRNKAWYQLASNGARMYPKLIEELTKDGHTETGYKRVGAMKLARSAKELVETKKRVLKRKENAPEIGEVTLLDPEQTKERFPLLAHHYPSVHISGAARVDGNLFRNALLRSAFNHGCKIIDGDAQLLYKGNRITGVTVNGESIAGDTVICTSGAWMGELLRPLGVHFQVTPQKAQLIHLQIPCTNTNEWPIVMPPNNQYLLPFDENRMVIGATHESKAGFDYRATVGGVHEVLSKALEIAPGLSHSTILETKIGFRPFTPGSLPVIGALPGFNGILLANGLGASGLTIGPYVGTELAKMALDMDLDVDLKDYDVRGAMKN